MILKTKLSNKLNKLSWMIEKAGKRIKSALGGHPISGVLINSSIPSRNSTSSAVALSRHHTLLFLV